MTTRTLVISNVLVGVICFSLGFVVNETMGPDPVATSNEGKIVDSGEVQAQPEKTGSKQHPSTPGKPQLAQAPFGLTEGDPGIASEAVLDITGEGPRGDTVEDEGGIVSNLTTEQKVATFRKLAEDPEVREAMMAESRQMMEDPERLKAQRGREELQAKFILDELKGKLNLADDEHDALVDLWVEGRMDEMALRRDIQVSMSSGEITEEERVAAEERIAAVKAQSEQKIAELLGANYEAYQVYVDTAVERANLNKLYSAGEPLDDYTKEALLLIMGEAKEAAGEPEPYYGMDMEVAVERMRTTLVAYTVRDAQVLERATSYLTPAQHEILAESLGSVRDQVESSIRMVENMLARRAEESTDLDDGKEEEQ